MDQHEPLWYKNGIFYEVHVRSFHDASGTGSGDFQGLTKKLDYLEDLGITAIWIQPFNPSPLRDDGYDIADYTGVNPAYGTLDDFKTFLQEAHRRGIRVITELVINHTSDQHPWFQRARISPPGSNERNFYVWSDSPDRYPNVPLMFPDYESSNWAWDPVAKQYYWHRFYSHQPDLNYDNPAVWQAIFPVVDFWFELGVDGMRLDAVPYLYEREGTSCEHLPETHAFLKALRAHVDERFPDKMFLAEANAWPEDAVKYFGNGDECHMAFHFPLMPRLFMSLVQEDRFPILDIFAQTPPIPSNAQWCLFLRNHDELTLAMVTDEERDSMFKVYARDTRAKIFLGIRHRLAPLLNNDRRRIELMNALLFSLPGTPVIYYGDEIGMGDNIYLGDRNGVRTPMQWSPDRNAGFSRANTQRLYAPVIVDPEYHYETVNVEAQQGNPSSLLWWMKRLIATRKSHIAFGEGTLEFVSSDNPKILTFIRRHESEIVLVVANLSRFVQHCRIDLREFLGYVPEELNGLTPFPPIGESPYPLALSAHGFYWFCLKTQDAAKQNVPVSDLPLLPVIEHWSEVVDGPGKDELELILPQFFRLRQPALAHDGIVSCRVVQSFPAPYISGVEVHIAIVAVEFREEQPMTVILPLRHCRQEEAQSLLLPAPRAVVGRVEGPAPGLIVDAAAMPGYAQELLNLVCSRKVMPLGQGKLAGRIFEPFDGVESAGASSKIEFNDDGSLTARFADRWILKIYRRLDEGIHPDLEIGRFLSARGFSIIQRVLGSAEYYRAGGSTNTLATLIQSSGPQHTAWQIAQHHLGQFFEKVTAMPEDTRNAMLLGKAEEQQFSELFGPGEDLAATLGKFVGTLHGALSSDRADPSFRPEIVTQSYQRSIYQSMRNQVERTFAKLARFRSLLHESQQERMGNLLRDRAGLLEQFRAITGAHFDGWRIRCQGDLHLSSLLSSGNDFLLADFSGDVSKPISERRIKRLPLRDPASLLLSLEYALASVVHGLDISFGKAPAPLREADRKMIDPWLVLWRERVERSLTAAYLESMDPTGLLPSAYPARESLMRLFLLEKALMRIEADLEERPQWTLVPLGVCFRMMGME